MRWRRKPISGVVWGGRSLERLVRGEHQAGFLQPVRRGGALNLSPPSSIDSRNPQV
jgi:hypothetical protein